MLLHTTEGVLTAARNMTWKGSHPTVRLVSDIYKTGVKLTKEAMAKLECLVERCPGLENWFVDIRPSPICQSG